MKAIAGLFALLFSCQIWALDVLLDGDETQGGMMLGKAPLTAKVWVNDVLVLQDPSGRFVFGFGRDEPGSAHIKVVFEDGSAWQRVIEVKPRDYNIQYVNGIDKAIASKEKPPEVWARIREEVAQVKAARKQVFHLQHYAGTFDWPLKGPITGVFGSQRVYNGEPGRPHYGLDIAAPVGTPVVAPAAGVVTLAHPDMYYSGGTLIIDHGFGISSSFLHLSEVLVEVGDTIDQGQLIAKVGAGGRSTGPHLDWRMNWFKKRLDPQLLLPPQAETSANKAASSAAKTHQ
ncbi:Murein DD-endopeptidase MepM [BD1-7 clade bacterium]|uniref:Murein DD-endopeptidase MepM n=1 Tax=BD1-7 clade bacterium TaxID=2029982 RepID=A0A5S9NNG6_9GAMM|nr:Murein DD-endopeptidase MepM [BD1-7 clade bacterium]